MDEPVGGPRASSCAAATSATCRCCASSWRTPLRRRGTSAGPDLRRDALPELAPEHAALFVGELDGVPLAADLVTRCGGLRPRAPLGLRPVGYGGTGQPAGRGALADPAVGQGPRAALARLRRPEPSDPRHPAWRRASPRRGLARRRPAEADLRRHRIPLSARGGNDQLAVAPGGLRPRPKLPPRAAGAWICGATAAQRAVLAETGDKGPGERDRRRRPTGLQPTH